MDFFIHTVFENRHITIITEDVTFFNDGFSAIVNIVDFNESGELEELSEDEFFTLHPKGEEFVYAILNNINENKNNYINENNPQKTIMLVRN